MKDIRVLLLILFLFAGPRVFAQSPCLDCLKTADQQLKACIENAISVEDKNSCEDNQEEQVKKCENSECKIEREDREKSIEAPSEGR
jgi:hypothetical protein